MLIVNDNSMRLKNSVYIFVYNLNNCMNKFIVKINKNFILNNN